MSILAPLWEHEPIVRTRRRLGGGWRQQQARDLERLADEGNQPPSACSLLAAGHLQKWCDGKESAAEVRQHMKNARNDGLCHPMVVRLSEICSDDSPNHAQAGLMELLNRTTLPNIISSIDGPISHVILPSSWIRLLCESYPHEFKQRLGADSAILERFWLRFLNRYTKSQLGEHRFLRDKSSHELKHTIPITVHEDAAPVTKDKGSNCTSFSSILGQGDAKVIVFLCCSSVKLASAEKAEVIAWREILRDCEALATEGVQDKRGMTWKFLVLFAKGDGEVHQTWGLPCHNDQEVCHDCMANRSTRPYTDLQANASWRPSEQMPFDFFVARARQPPHPLVESCVVWRWFFFGDIMHLMDCKGFLALVFGGVMYYLLRLPSLGRNQEERLKAVNDMRKGWYDANQGPNRLPKLLMSHMIGASGWADLHGPSIKAAITRRATQFFKYVADAHFTDGSNQHTDIRNLLHQLVEINRIIYTEPIFMANRKIAELREAMLEVGRSYQALREHARVRGDDVWYVTPKRHRAQHIPSMSRIINPRFVSNYGEERAMGTHAKVWRASVSGNYAAHVQRTVLIKRALGVLLRFET